MWEDSRTNTFSAVESKRKAKFEAVLPGSG